MRITKTSWISAVAVFLILFRMAGAQAIEQQYRSPEKAQVYAALGTIVPLGTSIVLAKSGKSTGSVAMVAQGLLLGPLPGYIYGGVGLHAVKGMAIRLLAGGVCVFSGYMSSDSESSEIWSILFPASTMTVFIDLIYDIAAVGNHVRSNNEKRSSETQSSISVYPRYFAESDAGGLQVNIAF